MRLPLIQPNVQRCPSCKSQIPGNGRTCSRLECGSAAISSPTILVVRSAVEPRHPRDQAGATGTGGSSTSRRNPSEFGVTLWRRRRAIHNDPSETWPGAEDHYAHPGEAFPLRNTLRRATSSRILCRSQIQPRDRAVTGHEGDPDAGPPDERTAPPSLRELAEDRCVRHGRDHDVVGGDIEQQRLSERCREQRILRAAQAFGPVDPSCIRRRCGGRRLWRPRRPRRAASAPGWSCRRAGKRRSRRSGRPAAP